MVLVNKVCKVCNSNFEVVMARKDSAKFCSQKCYWKSLKGKEQPKSGKYKNCKVCNTEFYVPPSFESQKFCSPNCYYESKKGNVPWNKGKKMPESFMKKLHLRPQHFKQGHTPHNKGREWSSEMKKKMSKARKGKYLGDENHMKKKKHRQRVSKQMHQVWSDEKLRKKYSKGWFEKDDSRFKTDSRFIRGMKKAIALNRERWKGNKFAQGRVPHNKLQIPPKVELKEFYTKQCKDAREIAEIYGTNMSTVLNWLEHYGIKKRPSLYGYNKKITCKAGHKVDSVGERRIADFLFEKKVSYLHNKVISKEKKILKRYDFYLPDFDLYIEYLGLRGKDFYDKRTIEKVKIYRDMGLNVIWIYPGENIRKRLGFLNIYQLSEFS